jgi:hypothetical protein
MSTPSNSELAAEILRRTAAQASGKSICPSEVARAFAPPAGTPGAEEAWRPLMPRVRKAALGLQAEGRIEILRKGKPVPAEEVRGVIRLRAAGAAEEPSAEA